MRGVVQCGPMKFLAALSVLVPVVTGSLFAQGAPRDNRYDTLGKVLSPIVQVMLTDAKSGHRALSLELEVVKVEGRLPKQFQSATLAAFVEYPDKVRLDAPVLGEQATVCRNGNIVWAIPGEKIEFLLGKFGIKLTEKPPAPTPLSLPISAQQAVFLPALFAVEEGGIEELHGEEVRVIEGGLMPELAQATKSEDFHARLWIAAGYLPRQVEIRRKDFIMTVAIRNLKFAESLPPATWQPPAGATDVFKASAGILQEVLYVVMNSLQLKPGEMPSAKPE